ncbi:MAG: GAF domain-containing protein [Candidatus Limnocylindrales bacterium]
MSDDGPPIDTVLAAVVRRLAAAEAIGGSAHDAVLPALAQAAVAVLDAQAASIAVHDPSTDRLVFLAAAGPAAGDVVGLSIEPSTGIAGYAFTTGQPLAVADVAADPRFDRAVADATGYVPNTLLATPLADAAGTVGVLEVLDRRGGTFTLRDLDIAAALAGAATAAVRAGRMERDAGTLLRRSLAALLTQAGAPFDEAALDDLVARAAGTISTDDDDPTWRLADRIARLRSVDPESIELAVDWLDALLRRSSRGPAAGPPGRGA